MKIDQDLLSALPYKPQIFREKNLYGIGHPDLVPVLKRLAAEKDPDLLQEARVIKDHPHLILKTSLLPREDFAWPRQVLKQFKWRGVQNYLASPLKKSKAIKSYLAACHLLKHGLGTPMPLGAVESRRFGFIQYNTYVTGVIDDFVVLKQYRSTLPHGVKGMDEVLQLLASYVRRMHDSGLLHKDLNMSNFLLGGWPGNFNLYLVDLNRARIRASISCWIRAVDLARLDLKEWQKPFFRYYCAERFDPGNMLRIANLFRFRRSSWRQVSKRTKNVRRKMGIR